MINLSPFKPGFLEPLNDVSKIESLTSTFHSYFAGKGSTKCCPPKLDRCLFNNTACTVSYCSKNRIRMR